MFLLNFLRSSLHDEKSEYFTSCLEGLGQTKKLLPRSFKLKFMNSALVSGISQQRYTRNVLGYVFNLLSVINENSFVLQIIKFARTRNNLIKIFLLRLRTNLVLHNIKRI
jgi:hypothetical protein